MNVKKFFCLITACALAVGCLGGTAGAAESPDVNAVCLEELEHDVLDLSSAEYWDSGASARAFGSIRITLDENEAGIADESFPLEVDETVTLNCSYSPSSASIDFGLIAPSGDFYYVNVTNGSINKTIRVGERGYYTLAVRNNSSKTVSVVGYVYY